MKAILLPMALFVSMIGSRCLAQVGQVYHRVGPVMFTNSAAFGYPDGSIAGTNFYCGVYAGTNAASLRACLSGGLRQMLSTNGEAVLFGQIHLAAPTNSPLLIQFRVWPAPFGTYEQALASSLPSPPVGVSGVIAAIPPNVIYEFPLEVGPVWLSPVPGSLRPDVQWHVASDHSPTVAFTLDNPTPTTTDTIKFVAPTDGEIYANGCWATVANGTPIIAVDSSNHAVNVTFSAPSTNRICPLYVLPVSGVDGQFGPLSAGTWTFNILQDSFPFTVTEAPTMLSIQTPADSGMAQITWRVSGQPFVLKDNNDLSSGDWQTPTNAPALSGDQATTLIPFASSSRFYRLGSP